jgi:hypothetical protein
MKVYNIVQRQNFNEDPEFKEMYDRNAYNKKVGNIEILKVENSILKNKNDAKKPPRQFKFMEEVPNQDLPKLVIKKGEITP